MIDIVVDACASSLRAFSHMESNPPVRKGGLSSKLDCWRNAKGDYDFEDTLRVWRDHEVRPVW